MNLMENNYVKTNINSNSQFFYKTNQTATNRDRIELPIDFSKKIQHLENLSPRQRPKSFCLKDAISPEKAKLKTAMEVADEETIRTAQRIKDRKDQIKQKENHITEMVNQRNKELHDKKINDKNELEATLRRIMLDALNYSKKNSPMLSMIPNDLSEALRLIQENRASQSFLNISNLSKQSHAKYEANAFLTALGVDIKNLTPETIRINVDMAFEFIKKWKVKEEEIPRIIRLKVTNEIMSVEGRRSVQKLSKYSDKINKYKDKQKQIKLEEQKRRKDEANRRKKEEEERELAEKLKKDPMERYRLEAVKINIEKKKEAARLFIIENAKRKRLGKPPLEDRFNIAESPLNTNLSCDDEEETASRKSSSMHINSFNQTKSITSMSMNSNKNTFRKKNASKKHQKGINSPKQPKKLLDTYKDAEKICGYIKGKENLNKNVNLKNHFKAVRENKKIFNAGRMSVDNNHLSLI